MTAAAPQPPTRNTPPLVVTDVVTRIHEAGRRMRIAAWGFANGSLDPEHLRCTFVDEELPDGMGLFERTVSGFRFELPADHPLGRTGEDPATGGRPYLLLVTLHVDRMRVTLLPEFDQTSGVQIEWPLREDRADLEGIATNIHLADMIQDVAEALEGALPRSHPDASARRDLLRDRSRTLALLAHGDMGRPVHVDLISGDEGREDLAIAIREDGPEWHPNPELVIEMTRDDPKTRIATASSDATLRFYDRRDDDRVWGGVLSVHLSRASAMSEIGEVDPVELLRTMGEWQGRCEPHVILNGHEEEDRDGGETDGGS